MLALKYLAAILQIARQGPGRRSTPSGRGLRYPAPFVCWVRASRLCALPPNCCTTYILSLHWLRYIPGTAVNGSLAMQSFSCYSRHLRKSGACTSRPDGPASAAGSPFGCPCLPTALAAAKTLVSAGHGGRLIRRCAGGSCLFRRWGALGRVEVLVAGDVRMAAAPGARPDGRCEGVCIAGPPAVHTGPDTRRPPRCPPCSMPHLYYYPVPKVHNSHWTTSRMCVPSTASSDPRFTLAAAACMRSTSVMGCTCMQAGLLVQCLAIPSVGMAWFRSA